MRLAKKESPGRRSKNEAGSVILRETRKRKGIAERTAETSAGLEKSMRPTMPHQHSVCLDDQALHNAQHFALCLHVVLTKPTKLLVLFGREIVMT